MIPEDINTLGVHSQYEIYYNHFVKKYGKVAVMYQHGAHFNFFGTEDYGNVKEISEDVTLRLTYTDKSKSGKNTSKNPMMAGFPITAKSDYIEKLLMKNYHVVEIREFKNKKTSGDRLIPREVTNIYTPGTYSDEFSDENYIIYIYVHGYKDNAYKPVSIGMCAIDINTGEMNYYEAHNTVDDEGYAEDEVYRYIHAHKSKEIIAQYKNTDFRIDNPNVKILETPKEISKNNLMISFLEAMFQNRNIKDVVEYLDLEMMQYAMTAITCLLYYVTEHNKTLVKNLKKPSPWFSEKYMLLANNAIVQLDIINGEKGKNMSVMNTVNFTSTPMGKRMLRYRLTHPLKDRDMIEKRYDVVEMFSEWRKYEEGLSGIVDLDKYHRLLELGTLTPLKMSFLLESYQNILSLFEKCPKGFTKMKKMKMYIEEILSTFDIEECRKYDTTESILSNIFKDGVSEKFDRIGKHISKCHKKMENIKDEIKSFLPSSAKPPVEKDENLGYYIRLTQTQFSKCKSMKLKKLPSRAKNYVWVVTREMEEISTSLIESENELCEKISKYYLKILKHFEKEFRNEYLKISRTVSEIDVYKSSAKCAEKYNYRRPQTSSKRGHLSATRVRHPLIERKHDVLYIPHDIKIGKEKGILIYGMNSGGKTVLMKAIGVNIVLAQAGLFIAAENFKYSPYDVVQTRILGNDNMHRGLSSFAVEMTELRGILARADNSFILGDEICHGTETISGLSIVAATLLNLVESSANFMFTTHLHELVNLPQIKKLDNIGIYHLKVERKGRKLIYKRTLEPGSGDSLYGLEVARAMGLPEDFIEKANEIRREIIDEEILGRQSRYHYKMFLKKCGICGARAEHSHHIIFQKEADKNGFIGHMHKNNLLNQVGLCEKCHHDVHKGKREIFGWDETSEGLLLKYN